MLIPARKRRDKGDNEQNDDGDKNDSFDFIRHDYIALHFINPHVLYE